MIARGGEGRGIRHLVNMTQGSKIYGQVRERFLAGEREEGSTGLGCQRLESVSAGSDKIRLSIHKPHKDPNFRIDRAFDQRCNGAVNVWVIHVGSNEKDGTLHTGLWCFGGHRIQRDGEGL